MTTLYSVSSYLTAMNVPALLSATIIHLQTCHTEFLAAFVSINATVCCGPWDQQIAYSEQAKI